MDEPHHTRAAPAASAATARRRWRRRARDRRLGAAMLVLTVVLGSIIGLNTALVSGQAGTASLVAGVARQRVLVERYGRDVALTIRGIEGGDPTTTARQLLQNARGLAQGGEVVVGAADGMRTVVVAEPRDARIADLLHDAERRAERLVALGRRALALGPEDARLSSLLTALEQRTADLSAVSGTALDAVEATARADATGLVRVVVGLGVLGLVASLTAAQRFRTLGRAEEHARYRALIEHASDVVLIVDDAAVVRYASPSVGRTCSLRPDDLVGRPLDELVHPDDHAALHRALRCGRGQAEVLEHRVQHADGRWLAAETRVTNLVAHPGIGGFVLNLHDVTERKELEAELQRRALQDPLTGLPNRVHLRARLEQALSRTRRTGEGSALLYVDLDGFKDVNDTLGHAAGDAVLVGVADVLRTAVRPQDTVARLGGDEFAILLEDLPCTSDRVQGHGGPGDPCPAVAVAGRILEAFERPLAAGGRSVVAGASIGIAHAEPDGDVEALLHAADAAMYTAKRQRATVAVQAGDLEVLAPENAAVLARGGPGS